MYAVIACPRCRQCRIVEAGKKTATCGSCARALVIREQRAWFSGPNLEEAQRVAGFVNAKLAGRADEFHAAFAPAAPAIAKHDDAFMAAAAATRKGRGAAQRAELVARELSQRMGTFTENDLTEAFHTAGLPAPEKHLQRMLHAHVLIEPRVGQYRAA